MSNSTAEPKPEPSCESCLSESEKLKNLASKWMAHSAEAIAKGAEVPQSFLMEDAAGKQSMVITPWTDQVSKEKALLSVALLLMRSKAVRYIHMGEAWEVEYVINGGVDIPADDPRPSQHPRRRECLIVSGASETGERIHLRAPIVRNDLGKRVVDVVDDTEPAYSASGLTELFAMKNHLRTFDDGEQFT